MNIALIIIGIVLIVVGIVRMAANHHAPEKQEYYYINIREPEPASKAETPVASAPVTTAEPAPAASAPTVAQTHAQPTPQPAPQPKVASQPATKTVETSEEWAKRVGNEFENFVANFFTNREVFTVLEWNQGQTSTEGVYAEADKNPDFKIKQEFGKNGLTYWIECKYRTHFNNRGAIIVKDYQLNRYRQIQSQSHRKIFLAIGVGENPAAPDEIFIVPLDSISSESIKRDDIAPYKMQNPRTDLAGWIKSYFKDKVFTASKKRKNKPAQ